MTEPSARLFLVTPAIADAAGFAPRLAEACGAGEIAAVLLRLDGADERTLINTLKALAPIAHEHGAAVLVSVEGEADLATVMVRGGADGVHLSGDARELASLRDRLKDRTIGAGGLRSKHDAMSAGEAEVDYVMFGEPRPDGTTPSLELTTERAAWWAEIFVTPCVAFAPRVDAVATLARTGAEFIALGATVWDHPEGPAAAVSAAQEALSAQEPAIP